MRDVVDFCWHLSFGHHPLLLTHGAEKASIHGYLAEEFSTSKLFENGNAEASSAKSDCEGEKIGQVLTFFSAA